MGNAGKGLMWKTYSEGGLRGQGQVLVQWRHCCQNCSAGNPEVVVGIRRGTGVTAGVFCPFCPGWEMCPRDGDNGLCVPWGAFWGGGNPTVL